MNSGLSRGTYPLRSVSAFELRAQGTSRSVVAIVFVPILGVPVKEGLYRGAQYDRLVAPKTRHNIGHGNSFTTQGSCVCESRTSQRCATCQTIIWLTATKVCPPNVGVPVKAGLAKGVYPVRLGSWLMVARVYPSRVGVPVNAGLARGALLR